MVTVLPYRIQSPLPPKKNAQLSPKGSVILLLVETDFSAFGRSLSQVMDALRLKYRTHLAGLHLPTLSMNGKGKYSMIVFENYYKYLNMDSWNRDLLDKYCREYGAGIIGFLESKMDTFYRRAKVKGFPLSLSDNVEVRDVYLNPEASDFFYIARAGSALPGQLNIEKIAVFHVGHETYQPLILAQVLPDDHADDVSVKAGLFTPSAKLQDSRFTAALAVHDIGRYDGIERVLFGHNFSFWLHKLVFIDSLMALSGHTLDIPLERFLQIDIDDIFVGKSGLRMTSDDVEELVKVQKRLHHFVPNFKFTLGFSGKMFLHGNANEDAGDRLLLEKSSEFLWFPHSWEHKKAHLYTNQSLLEQTMEQNRYFAQVNNLPLAPHYAVAPHHAGVYPVHEQLYQAWRNVWDIRVTSTEQYPNLHPASKRRGFHHDDVMVLPRQTCGLFTHTVWYDEYPGGPGRLEESILGGDLFFTMVYYPFLVFMTHSTNYANDRLALYTFEKALNFASCWTNLKFHFLPPLEMAQKYFRRYPDDILPIWGNPCLDKRHKAIWSPVKACDQFPKALIVGPQKTGSTALYTFLSLHPSLVPNLPSETTFEEVQFFSSRNYFNGIEWYQKFFPTSYIDSNHSLSSLYYFEKSATYFDREAVPERVRALMPDCKIIIIIVSSVGRAYSWFHHQRSHGDPAASEYFFEDVITAGRQSPKELRKLRARCLQPGHFAVHVERWLEHFAPKQIMLVDGDELRRDPVPVLTQVQDFLEVERLDYTGLLKFDEKKGFFCIAASMNKTKCLGSSKGRKYPEMHNKTKETLLRYYKPYNLKLERLLRRLGYPVPKWLVNEIGAL